VSHVNLSPATRNIGVERPTNATIPACFRRNPHAGVFALTGFIAAE
jgi:hypothetical protein